ncbi:MAG: type I CRISPR-associated protein Cas7 [bacterium]
MTIKNAEILFVKSVKDGIPNRDPLQDSDARRLFGEDDGRISLSDVSLKRDVRDYILAKYPDGGPGNRFHIWCREERNEKGDLLGRAKLAEKIIEATANPDLSKVDALLQSAFDMRTFGAVFSVEKAAFHRTGPTQFGWAHSLHPAQTKYVQGTTVMPSEEDSKGQGTIWTTYFLPFAVFAMPGVINTTIAKQTGMDQQDVELLLEGLWNGTLLRQARGRGFQKPQLLLHVEYQDPYFRIGYLEDGLFLEPGRETWLVGNSPTAIADVKLDVSGLAKMLDQHKEKIARIRWWKNEELTLKGILPGEQQQAW